MDKRNVKFLKAEKGLWKKKSRCERHIKGTNIVLMYSQNTGAKLIFHNAKGLNCILKRYHIQGKITPNYH